MRHRGCLSSLCFFWEILDNRATYGFQEPNNKKRGYQSAGSFLQCKLLLIVAKAVQIPLQNSSHLIAYWHSWWGTVVIEHWLVLFTVRGGSLILFNVLRHATENLDSRTCRLLLIRLSIRGSILPPCGQPYSVLPLFKCSLVLLKTSI